MALENIEDLKYSELITQIQNFIFNNIKNLNELNIDVRLSHDYQ